MLIAVAVTALLLGTTAGVVAACVGGLALDLGSAGPVGLHALALLPAGWIAGRWPRWFGAMAASLAYAGVILAWDRPPVAAGAHMAILDSAGVVFAFLLVRLPSLGRISRRAQA